MGFFGSGDKTTSTTNTQLGASEDAQLASAQSVVGKDDAVVLGGTQNRNVIGNDASQGQGVINNGALAIGGAGNNLQGADITLGYDAGQFQTALQSVGSNLSNALNSQSAASNTTLDAVLNKLSALAESKQTDGASAVNKNIVWIVAGLLLLLGYLFRRK